MWRDSHLRRLLEIQVTLSPTLSKNEKIEHHIRMKINKLIGLRFWVGGGINSLCVGWVHVSLVLYLHGNPLSKDPSVVYCWEIQVVLPERIPHTLSHNLARNGDKEFDVTTWSGQVGQGRRLSWEYDERKKKGRTTQRTLIHGGKDHHSRSDSAPPKSLASFAQDYRKLAIDCLKVLRIEMQLETIFHMQEMANTEYLDDQDAEEPDDFIISLTSQMDSGSDMEVNSWSFQE
ncbi:hypothetical protein V8G54_002277 [Vigna mungo]|uniref:Exocyst complex component Sec8 n=1 Tax=Vigna mungo TaxID=3915 RepID=A0AAQ3SBQ2_VIGMU